MDHADHVALIRGGVAPTQNGRASGAPRWLELGAGEGAFTLALADVLAPGGSILATDRDARALDILSRRVRAAFPGTPLETRVVDFTTSLPTGPFDGVLAANSLHFVRDRAPTLDAIGEALAPGGSLVVVEYDADDGNQWVPYPFSFDSWRREAVATGYEEPRLVHRVPSRFLGAIYGAITRRRARP